VNEADMAYIPPHPRICLERQRNTRRNVSQDDGSGQDFKTRKYPFRKTVANFYPLVRGLSQLYDDRIHLMDKYFNLFNPYTGEAGPI